MVKEVNVVTKLNKSTKFLLPLIATSYITNILQNPSFINTYIEFPNILIIQSRDSNIEWGNSTYLKEIVHHNGSFFYKYLIPNEFCKEFDYFITGKYSKFSNKAKEIICYSNNGGHRKNIENSLVYKVLYKTPDRKQFIEDRLGVKLPIEAELFSIPNIEEELYGGESIKV